MVLKNVNDDTGFESVFECRHLVEDASHGPKVRLVVVRFVLPNFRTQVVRGADASPITTLLIELS